MTATWPGLFVQTVRDPRDAANTILSRSLSRQELYMGVALCAALATLLQNVFAVTLMPLLLAQAPDVPVRMVPPIMSFLVSAGLYVLFANIVTWAGRAMGGQGALEHVLQLTVWQQIVFLSLQAFGFLLIYALPLAAMFYILIVFFIYLRMVLVFIQTAHGLETLGTAFAVLFVAIVGVMVGMVLISTLLGAGG